MINRSTLIFAKLPREEVPELKFYGHQLDKVPVVTSDSLEKLLALKPDLIITYSTDKNLKKLTKIAPTEHYLEVY